MFCWWLRSFLSTYPGLRVESLLQRWFPLVPIGSQRSWNSMQHDDWWEMDGNGNDHQWSLMTHDQWSFCWVPWGSLGSIGSRRDGFSADQFLACQDPCIDPDSDDLCEIANDDLPVLHRGSCVLFRHHCSSLFYGRKASYFIAGTLRKFEFHVVCWRMTG